MRRILIIALGSALLVGCGGGKAPSTDPTASAATFTPTERVLHLSTGDTTEQILHETFRANYTAADCASLLRFSDELQASLTSPEYPDETRMFEIVKNECSLLLGDSPIQILTEPNELQVYAQMLCQPLQDLVEGVVMLDDKYSYLSPDASIVERMPMLRELAPLTGTFADQLQAIRDSKQVPDEARLWHDGWLREMSARTELISALDKNDIGAVLAFLKKTPLPSPTTTPAMSQALSDACGPDLLAKAGQLMNLPGGTKK